MDNLGVFDAESNKVRVRSLFKIEMQKLAESVHLIHKEIILELEERYGVSHVEVPNFPFISHFFRIPNFSTPAKAESFVKTPILSSTCVPPRQTNLIKMRS
jgi:hypothetical protein